MDSRHISVSLDDGVTAVQFHDLARIHDSCLRVMEIGDELRWLADDTQPCSANKAFMPPTAFCAELLLFERLVL